MRLSMIVTVAALSLAAPAVAQVSIGGITLGQPSGGGPNDGIQHTNAARVDLGGDQAARVVAVPGRDTPAKGGADVAVAPGQGSNVQSGSAGAGAAATDGGPLDPKGYVSARGAGTSLDRSVSAQPPVR